MRFDSRKCFSILGLAFALVACAFGQASNDSAAVKDFKNRVSKYMSLTKRQVPSTEATDSPDKLADQKQHVTQKTQATRPAAHQGDVFTPAIASYFKQTISRTMRGSAGEKIRASLRHAEPLPTFHLQVNEPYPKGLPLQSTPPTLLMSLPPLPKGLEYRIVGSTLLLYDVPSNLVVDIIPDAIMAA